MVKPVSDQFISNLFLVPKRDGKSRPVINLKDLNTFLQYDHFKMEGIHLLRDLLQPHDWLGKIDLKNAYFVIPIWKNHRFLWKDTLLEFACLPFGLAVAPRLFTKVMKPVVALLRRARRYPSDHLLGRSAVHESIAGGPGAGYGNCALLARKSRVCCQFRQVMLRSNPAVGISRVSSQQSGYDSAPSRLQSGGSKEARRICPGVVSAHRETDGIHTGHISGPLALPISSAPETPSSSSAKRVRCNNSSVKRNQGRVSLVVSPPRCMEWSRASSPSSRSRDRDRCFEEGLGGSMPGCENRGLWSQMERTLHINCLELLAGSFAVRSFAKGRLCAHVRLRMDNTSAVAYVNRLGGTRSLVLSNLALDLWEWALSQNIFLSAEHLAGRMNVMADWQSRHFTDSSNWRLCPEVFQALMQVRGPCAKDLFADRLNTQLPRFCSWKPDPMALAVDALQQDWSKEKNYICLSPVLPDHESTGEVAGIRRGTDTSHAVVAHTGLVSHPPGHVSVVTGSSAHEQQSPIRASRGYTPTDPEHDSPVSRVACIKRSLQSEDICANASKLILAAWRSGTNAIYNSAWKKWHSWCLGRKVDSLRPTLADI